MICCICEISHKYLNCVFSLFVSISLFRDLLLMQITKQKRELAMRAESELTELNKKFEVGEYVNE